MTVSPAIAAFAAAGNDIDALEKAIEEASYLDATPGEERQKLRGMTHSSPAAGTEEEVPSFCRAYERRNRWWPFDAATRTRVKRLKKEAIAKAEAAAKDAATKGPKERSPHIKEVQARPVPPVECSGLSYDHQHSCCDPREWTAGGCTRVNMSSVPVAVV